MIDTFSVARHCARGLLFKVHVNFRAHVDADAKDGATLEPAGRFVFVADRIAAVETDAKTVAGQGELAGLGSHIALGHGLAVDIERRLADRLALRTVLLASELHAE